MKKIFWDVQYQTINDTIYVLTETIVPINDSIPFAF